MDEDNFAVDRNGGRWSLLLSWGVLMPLDEQKSQTVEGYLRVSLPPEEVEKQHGPLTWYKRPDDVPPNDFRP